MNYERLTKRNEYGMAYVPNNDIGDMAILKAIERLAELEDKIENGTLFEIKFPVGSKVYKHSYSTCHNGETLPDSYECCCCKDECDLKRIVVECTVASIEHSLSIERDLGLFYFATREEAKAKLKVVNK